VANVGNTHIRLVRWSGGAKVDDRRVPTREATAEPLPAGLPIALVSVVPEVADRLAADWMAAGHSVFRLDGDHLAGLSTSYEGLGADRLANAIALWHRHGAGIAIDGGTATTLTLVDQHGVLRGGAILPGLATQRDSLWQATAQLPAVPLEPAPRAIGGSTLESLQVGLVDGHVGALVHLVRRMRLACPTATGLVVTGGWGALLTPLLLEEVDAEHAPDLTVEGAAIAYATRPAAL
jgi:type III pantothenate kinase